MNKKVDRTATARTKAMIPWTCQQQRQPVLMEVHHHHAHRGPRHRHQTLEYNHLYLLGHRFLDDDVLLSRQVSLHKSLVHLILHHFVWEGVLVTLLSRGEVLLDIP